MSEYDVNKATKTPSRGEVSENAIRYIPQRDSSPVEGKPCKVYDNTKTVSVSVLEGCEINLTEVFAE